jgi:diguanylate cyclase (GGDEF)-like protein
LKKKSISLHHYLIYGLILASLSLLSAYFLDIFTIKKDLLNAPFIERYEAVSNIDIETMVLVSEQVVTSTCTYTESDLDTYCGMIFRTSVDNEQGQDFSDFDSFNIKIASRVGVEDPQVKITFKNFNPIFSVANDYESAKYNSVNLVITEEALVYNIPFDFLQVESWWIERRNIPLDLAQAEVNNVIAIELINRNVKNNSSHILQIEGFELVGESVSLTTVLSCVIAMAIMIILLLIDKQRGTERLISMLDPLTSLVNRRGQLDWLNSARISPTNPRVVSIMYIDIDDFKSINDTYGHKVGDLVLIEFSNKVNKVIKKLKYTSKQLNFCRLSGDEFIIIGLGLTNRKMSELATRMLRSLNKASLLGGNQIQTNISVGITTKKQYDTELQTLLTEADTAMYYAKRAGKNQFRVYQEDVTAEITKNDAIARSIQAQIKNDRFVLVFTPILDVESKDAKSIKLCFEPDTDTDLFKAKTLEEYRQLALDYSQGDDFDNWLENAFIELTGKYQHLLVDKGITMTFSLSEAQVSRVGFASQFLNKITIAGCSPKTICVAINEVTYTKQTSEIYDNLNSLKDAGCVIRIAKFKGKSIGFSDFPSLLANEIEFDETLTYKLAEHDTNSCNIVEAILSLAKSYDKKVLAINVDSLELYTALQKLDFDLVEGGLFFKNMPTSELSKYK